MQELTKDLKDLIRRQMEEIPLTGALLDQACDAFEKMANSRGLNGAYGSDETKSSWQFKHNIERAAELLGVDKDEYIQKAALKQPQLFYQSPETINANITRATELLGIDKHEYIQKAALKKPSLFAQSPETIDANITRAAELLGIDKSEYIQKAALKQPQLFYQSPETINANITRAAELLGIDKREYIQKAALKLPQLFYRSPETINANITRAAELLGIDKREYIQKAALKQPPLFCQSPETINANITRTAELLGVDKGAYIQKAALKQPPLFCLSPNTIKRNVDFIVDAHHRGSIRSDDLIRDILDYPVALCCAPANTHLRAIHAFNTNKSFTLKTFFTAPGRNKTEITRELVKHYADLFNRTGKGLKTLQTLARAKEYPPVEGRATSIIPESALPDWAQP